MPSTSEYSRDKVLFHLDRLQDMRDGKQPYPVHVQLIISDYCNQNCSFCSYRTENYSSNQLFKIIDNGVVNNNPKRMIPWDKLQELVQDCEEMNVKAIQLTGGGEPTVHPQFDQLCQLILDKKIGLALVTNGLLLKKKRAEMLAQADWLRVSVDCSNERTYASVRDVPPDEFDIVARNIKNLTSLPDRKVVVGVGFVVTKNNFREIYDGCKLFKSWGADNVRISAVFQNDGHEYFAGIHEEIVDQVNMCVKLLNDDKFTVFNNFGLRYGDLELGSPDYSFCPYMNLTTYVGGDQTVYTCCVNAYNSRGIIGSIKDQRFKDLWDSQPKQDFFRGFDAKNCERCMFNEKNSFINNLLRPPTVHDNFV